MVGLVETYLRAAVWRAMSFRKWYWGRCEEESRVISDSRVIGLSDSADTAVVGLHEERGLLRI